MPSDSRIRMSSSLMTWPFASSFFPPGRNTVQQSMRPVETFTSTVCAFIQSITLKSHSAKNWYKAPWVGANYREVVRQRKNNSQGFRVSFEDKDNARAGGWYRVKNNRVD